MEPEYSKETLTAEILKLEQEVDQLRAENALLKSKMKRARSNLTPEQAEIKRVFNPTGLWDYYENSKSNY